MLEVQKFLKSYESVDVALSELENTFGIKARQYPEDNLILLDYNQIESPKTHPITIECRSLILNYDFEVVSRKFDRFFNFGEAPETLGDFNAADAVVMEKVDGSLIGVYYNAHVDRWEISTRGMAKAEGEHIFGGTFREKVLEAFGFKSELDFQQYFLKYLFEEVTHIFEFISPENRIVTKYADSGMVLTGMRVNSHGLQFPYTYLAAEAEAFERDGLKVRVAKCYDAKDDLALLADMANELQNLEEGFVVWEEKTGKRVKIKSKTYLVAHKIRGNETVPTRKNLLVLALEGEVDEFLAYFPEWEDSIRSIQSEIREFEDQLTSVWLGQQAYAIEDQKEFALLVKDLKGSGFFFEAKKKKTNPVHAFHESDINKKLRIFGE